MYFLPLYFSQIILKLSLPLTDSVAIFGLILLILLVMPLLFRKLRLPSLVGLILAGILVGPKGVHVLELDNSILLFSKIGLLYIMFLAGIEIDFRNFKKTRNKSLVFGAFTFLIPLTVGTISSLYLLNFDLTAALLLASMYSTHTLVSYPIVSKLGITKNDAVSVSVGGTIVTDTIALLLLSFIVAHTGGAMWQDIALKMLISFSLFVFGVMVVMAQIARWFFRNVESEGTSQYIFVLLVVFVSGFLAEISGIEAIIGAFLAGLSLNRFIPHASALMNRISFIGNALFIPIFLLSVGMRVDFWVLFSGIQTIKVILLLLAVALSTKWIAAYITQKIYGFSTTERQIIFGLSASHAAATLAIVLIGYDLKLFDAAVLNATIILILVSCLTSTIVTERAAKKLVVRELEKAEADVEGTERILIPMANPDNFVQLIELAILIKNPQSIEPIYPLTVVHDDALARQSILLNNKRFERAIAQATAADVEVSVTTRVDLNPASGIIRAMKDLAISDIVIGWNGKPSAVDMFFGSIMAQVLENTPHTVLVSKILQPINTFRRLVVVVPENAELEAGFDHVMEIIRRMGQQLGLTLSFFLMHDRTGEFSQRLKKTRKSMGAEVKQLPFDWDYFESFAPQLSGTDLLCVLNARQQTVSHRKMMDRLPRILANNFEAVNFVILYPKQNILTEGAAYSETFLG
jgi:Kef-type K+ transport system membrane component KefB